MSWQAFARLLRQKPLPLAQAALQYAAGIAYFDLDIPYYLSQLDRLARQASSRIPERAAVAERAAALAEFLFRERAFRGNSEDYGDPRNSFLNDVLVRRLGIPITLSLVYLEVAHRLELPAYGIGLPGHFVVGVSAPGPPLILDPFHKGRVLTVPACVSLVRQTTGYQGAFDRRWLAPVPPANMLLRMLNNLRIIYLESDRWTELLAVVGHMQLITPEDTQLWRDLGVAYLHTGAIRLAAHHLDAYLRHNPDSADAEIIRRALRPALSGWGRLN